MSGICYTFAQIIVSITKAKPFYQSTIGMELEPIEKDVYVDFALNLFEKYGKKVDSAVVQTVYDRFYGYTWYVQMVMNELFFMTGKGETCAIDMIEPAVANIISSQAGYYKNILSICGTKQRTVLIALANDEMKTGKFAEGVTTSDFMKRYSLPSASSVQAAIKGLIEKNIVTPEDGEVEVNDALCEFIYNAENANDYFKTRYSPATSTSSPASTAGTAITTRAIEQKIISCSSCWHNLRWQVASALQRCIFPISGC